MQVIGGCNADPDSFDIFGDLLAYGCGPCVLVQHLNTFRTVCYLPLKFGIITCIRFFSPSQLIIGTCEGYLMIVDLDTKVEFSIIHYESSITHLALKENNVVISTALNGLSLLRVVESELVRVEDILPELRCTALDVTTVGEEVLLGIGWPDGRIELLVPSTGEKLFMDGSAWTLALRFAWNEDTLVIAAAGQEKVIKVWKCSKTEESIVQKLGNTVAARSRLNIGEDTFTIELLAVMSGHSDWVNGIDFYDSKNFCSASFDGQLLVWAADENDDYDITRRVGTTAVSDDQSGFIGCKLLSPNDAVAVSRNGGFSRWIDGRTVRCFAGHTNSVTSVTYTTIGCFISVSLDSVGRVYQRDGDTYRESARPLIHGHAIYDVGSVADDLYAFAADEKCVRLLQPTLCFAKHNPDSVLSTYELPFAAIPALTLDNKVIKTAKDIGESVQLNPSDFMKDHIPDAHEMWLTRWPEVKSLWGHERELRKMTISSGDWFASGDDRGGYVIWDKRLERRNAYVRDESKSQVTAMSAAPDASFLLLVLENGTVRLINPVTSTISKEIRCPEGEYSCGWSSDSEYFSVGGRSGIFIYERDGTLAANYKGVYVTALQFTRDLDLLIGLESGEVIGISYHPSERTFAVQKTYHTHSGRVNTIKWNASNKEFITCGDDHTIIVNTVDYETIM